MQLNKTNSRCDDDKAIDQERNVESLLKPETSNRFEVFKNLNQDTSFHVVTPVAMKDLEKQVQDRVKLPDKTNKSSLSTKKTL
jgi:hypothetical protein